MATRKQDFWDDMEDKTPTIQILIFLIGVYIFFYFASRGWKAGK
jgi:hypothetical protein